MFSLLCYREKSESGVGVVTPLGSRVSLRRLIKSLRRLLQSTNDDLRQKDRLCILSEEERVGTVTLKLRGLV